MSNSIDPQGLEACGAIKIIGWVPDTGLTVASLLKSGTDLGLLATTIFAESVKAVTVDGRKEMSAIGAVIINRYNVVNGYVKIVRADGTVQGAPGAWGVAAGTLRSIIVNPTQFEVWQGPGDTLTTDAQRRLTAALNAHPDSNLCMALLNAVGTARLDLGSMNTESGFRVNGLTYTGFNSFKGTQRYDWEQFIGSSGSGNKLYGVPTPIPVQQPTASRYERNSKIPVPRVGRDR